MNPSSPFMEELRLDIQKEISLKKQSLIFPKITKMQSFKGSLKYNENVYSIGYSL